MATLSYPAAFELREIEQIKLPRLVEARPIFRHFPIVEADAFYIEWEQKDNYKGLQAVRGINGAPTRVTPVGASRFVEQPGVYGEFAVIDEREITLRRPWGTRGELVIPIDDLVMDRQDMLLLRRLDRIEWIIWTLLATGTFSVANDMGGVVHQGAYTFQSQNAAVVWSTSATATPLADFRAVQLKGRGTSSAFDANSEAWMNRSTYNEMLANTNSGDLAGRRTSGFQVVPSLEEINRIQAGDGLPTIVVYDEGYIDEASTFQLFIPNDKVVVIGRRSSGAALGEYRMVRNASNPNAEPGAYTEVIRNPEPPKDYRVHDGHNGGPAIFYPGAVCILNV